MGREGTATIVGRFKPRLVRPQVWGRQDGYNVFYSATKGFYCMKLRPGPCIPHHSLLEKAYTYSIQFLEGEEDLANGNVTGSYWYVCSKFLL